MLKRPLPLLIVGFLACISSLAAAETNPAPKPASAAPASPSRMANWQGDFDGILERRSFRLIVPYSRTLFFVDRGRQMGVAAEFGLALESWLNKRYRQKIRGINVVFVPKPAE